MKDLLDNLGNKIFAYARVSKLDQNPERQYDALNKHGYDKLFDEKISGGKLDRPALKKLFEHLRAGDSVVIESLDRLARSSKDLMEIAEKFEANKINFISIYDKIDTTTAIGKFFYQVSAACAELERNRLRERTMDGLKDARERGRIGGRKKGISKPIHQKCLSAYNEYMSKKDISIRDACQLHEVQPSTYYRWKAEYLKGRESQMDVFHEK
jgi:DNA invertase Pin-like site-specific DNA recombinase